MSDSLRGQGKQRTQCVVTSCGVLDNILPSHTRSWRSPYHVILSHLRHNALDNNNTAVGATASCTAPPTPHLCHMTFCGVLSIFTPNSYSHTGLISLSRHPWSLPMVSQLSDAFPLCPQMPRARAKSPASCLAVRTQFCQLLWQRRDYEWGQSDMNHY